jgi:predicted RNase H-like HicB family nuclease
MENIFRQSLGRVSGYFSGELDLLQYRRARKDNRTPRGWSKMLEYHAAYYQGESGWVVAKVLDFPGALSQGRTLTSARRMIRDALRLMAETLVEEGEPLPLPKVRAKDKKALFLETIPLG